MNPKKIALNSAVLIALCGLVGCGQDVSTVTTTKKAANIESTVLTYPVTKKVMVVDDYFGTKVTDAYRWLEDDMSAETAEWVAAQNKTTHDYLAQIPYRDKIKSRLAALLDYEKVGMPFIEGDYSYFYKNDGLQNQYVLYRQKGDAPAEVFLDPNTFSEDGTVSLANIEFSEDGSLAVYLISEGGSDWRKARIIEYYHELGTAQSADALVFGGIEAEKHRYVSGEVTKDGRYLLVSAAVSTSGNKLFIKDLTKADSALVTVVANTNSDTNLVSSKGDDLLFITNMGAPNKRVVKVNAKQPSVDNWLNVIPETENVLSVSTGGKYLFAKYMKDATSLIQQYDLNGKKVRDIALPEVGTAGGFSGKESQSKLYYSFSNQKTPSTIFSLDVGTGESVVHMKSKVKFDSDNFESKQVFYTSKDGTKVPMIITHKKGLVLDGTNPTILYGYGGFNVSLQPQFSSTRAAWLELGGVYAVANLRGGGEYGKKWHDAGTQLKKQNVFDDFIAAAEYLIAEKVTSSDKLAVMGGSNGGLLVGAVMTQRPELFKVALPAVGVLDMLRYHTFTSGAGWAYDYGKSDDNAEMFNYLLGYSPVHNVKAGTHYPATMVTTGDHDDRVVPAHSFKFAAELQAKQAGANPTLIRIETDAGHGAGTPISKTIDQYADIYGFTLFNMGVKDI